MKWHSDLTFCTFTSQAHTGNIYLEGSWQISSHQKPPLLHPNVFSMLSKTGKGEHCDLLEGKDFEEGEDLFNP